MILTGVNGLVWDDDFGTEPSTAAGGFKVKINGVVNAFLDEAEHHHIHRPMVTLIAYYTSLVEFVCGITLVLGLFTDYSLYLLGLDLLLAAFAFSLVQPMWDMKHLFPRFILVITLLLFPAEWNKRSLDFLFNLI